MKNHYLLLELEDCIEFEWVARRTIGTEVLGRFVASLDDNFDEIPVVAPVVVHRHEAVGAGGLTH